jgi:hypothetical protein
MKLNKIEGKKMMDPTNKGHAPNLKRKGLAHA